MSAATLLNPNEPAFDFEHRQAHQSMLIKSGGSSIFSGTTYWIDPAYGDTTVPAGWGNTLHAQLHASFLTLFPALSGASAIASVNDIALRPEAETWAAFSNFQLHYAANQAS